MKKKTVSCQVMGGPHDTQIKADMPAHYTSVVIQNCQWLPEKF